MMNCIYTTPYTASIEINASGILCHSNQSGNLSNYGENSLFDQFNTTFDNLAEE